MPPDLTDEDIFDVLTARWALPNTGLGYHVEKVAWGCQLYEYGIAVSYDFADWILDSGGVEFVTVYLPPKRKYMFAESVRDWQVNYHD